MASFTSAYSDLHLSHCYEVKMVHKSCNYQQPWPPSNSSKHLPLTLLVSEVDPERKDKKGPSRFKCKHPSFSIPSSHFNLSIHLSVHPLTYLATIFLLPDAASTPFAPSA
uniref:Uncharacterized protein n=1 Tax=Micrurus spixii TaxID=129469 RepID=A0A2D4NJG8_9SAUR